MSEDEDAEFCNFDYLRLHYLLFTDLIADYIGTFYGPIVGKSSLLTAIKNNPTARHQQ